MGGGSEERVRCFSELTLFKEVLRRSLSSDFQPQSKDSVFHPKTVTNSIQLNISLFSDQNNNTCGDQK